MLSTFKNILPKEEKTGDKENRYHRLYIDIAKRISEMSYAKRSKVGCVIVKDGRIISMGWNGMPTGWDNKCEHLVLWDNHVQLSHPILVTNDEVLHAESNAIAKLARDGQSSLGCTVYVTLAPCLQCAKLIHQSGINQLVYTEDYRDSSGLEFLKKTPNFNIIKLEE